ncbi:MAG: hemolysin D, partial [Planctomycetota bacterium]
MSSEQSLDPRLIEETKKQIRGLVQEIAQLAKKELSPQDFYGEFLSRVVSALAAIGGAVWTVEDQGRMALQHQINLQETKLRDSQEDQVQHGRLLQKVLTSGEGMLVPPRSGAGDDDAEAANPTDFLLVLGPLKSDKEITGVVEVFQRADSLPATQRGYLRFLMQMCEIAGDFIKTRQLRSYTDRQALWSRLEEFTRAVHASLDPRETAYVIANEGRRLIECDRVSVALSKGGKCSIQAISGQDLFDKRSNTVVLLSHLATAVVATGDPVWYTGDTSDMAPQVEDAIQEYVDESHSKTVAVLPLKRPRPFTAEAEEDPKEKRLADETDQAFGAVIVEQIEDARVPESMLQRVDVVCEHSSTALGNAREHNSLFMMPVWKAIGKTRVITRARNLPWTI